MTCVPYYTYDGKSIYLSFNIDGDNSLTITEYISDCATKTGLNLKFVENSSGPKANITLLPQSVCGLPATASNGSLIPLYQAQTRAKWLKESCNPIKAENFTQLSLFPPSDSSVSVPVLPPAMSKLLEKARESYSKGKGKGKGDEEDREYKTDKSNKNKESSSSISTYFLQEYWSNNECSEAESPFWAKECMPNNICLPFKDGTSINIMAHRSGLTVGVFFMGGCNSWFQLASVDFGTTDGSIATEGQCATTVMLNGAVQKLDPSTSISMKYSIVDCPIIPTVLGAAFHKYDIEGIELPHSMQNMLQAARITSRARIFIVYLVAAIVFSIVGVLGLGCYVRKRMSRENDYDAVPVEQYQAATDGIQLQQTFQTLYQPPIASYYQQEQ